LFCSHCLLHRCASFARTGASPATCWMQGRRCCARQSGRSLSVQTMMGTQPEALKSFRVWKLGCGLFLLGGLPCSLKRLCPCSVSLWRLFIKCKHWAVPCFLLGVGRRCCARRSGKSVSIQTTMGTQPEASALFCLISRAGLPCGFVCLFSYG
jgi:hypothetical protein